MNDIGPDSDRNDDSSNRNRNHSNAAQNPNGDNQHQNPAFFLSLSHTHAVQTARRYLNIQQGQNLQAVTAQYKRLARRFHPDKWHESIGCTQAEGTRIFQCIANAYTLLRQHYAQ